MFLQLLHYTYRNPLASISDVVEKPIVGPGLCIGDHILLWEEPSSATENVNPIGKCISHSELLTMVMW